MTLTSGWIVEANCKTDECTIVRDHETMKPWSHGGNNLHNPIDTSSYLVSHVDVESQKEQRYPKSL